MTVEQEQQPAPPIPATMEDAIAERAQLLDIIQNIQNIHARVAFLNGVIAERERVAAATPAKRPKVPANGQPHGNGRHRARVASPDDTSA